MPHETDDLRQALMDAPNLQAFLSDHADSFSHESVRELLGRLLDKKRISKATLARRAGMSEIYLHQIFAGRRNPSRNRLICLCVGLSASLEETQYLLKQCGLAQLYAKNRRDAIILYCLNRRKTLAETQELLQSMELTILGGDNGYGG